MIGRTVIRSKFIQGSANAGSHIGVIAGSLGEKRVPYKLNDLIQRDRRFRGVDDSFEFWFKAHKKVASGQWLAVTDRPYSDLVIARTPPHLTTNH